MAKHGQQWKCKDCNFSNYSFRTVCRRCAEAKRWGDPPPSPLPGGPRTPGGRWSDGPPTTSYALEVVKQAFGQEEADRIKAANTEKTKEPEERTDIASMVAAAEQARKQFGDAAAAPLDALVREARRKRDEAKKPHLRVRDAEAREESTKKAKEAAQKERDKKQKELDEAEEAYLAAEAKHAAAKAEVADVKATVYRDDDAEASQQAKTKGAHNALATLRNAGLLVSEQGAALLAQIEAGLPAVPPPAPAPRAPRAEASAATGEAAAQSAAAAAQERAAATPVDEDAEMPAWEELFAERTQAMVRKWGDDEQAEEKAK